MRAQYAQQPAYLFLLLSSYLYLMTQQLTHLCAWLVPVPAFALSILNSGYSLMLFLVFVLKCLPGFILSVPMLAFKSPKDSPDYMAWFMLLHRKQSSGKEPENLRSNFGSATFYYVIYPFCGLVFIIYEEKIIIASISQSSCEI